MTMACWHSFENIQRREDSEVPMPDWQNIEISRDKIRTRYCARRRRPHHDAREPVSAGQTMQHSHVGHDQGAMMADFRRRFQISMALTVPVLALSAIARRLLGFGGAVAFPGSNYLLLALSAVVYFYGGWPFLRGLHTELSARKPGMMTLIALAISVAFFYSSAVVLGVPGEVLFWELVTLMDVMLLGHWIEMKSVMGASGALEALVRLLPATAHRLRDDGESEDVPIAQLRPGNKVLVKPGERVPTDGIILRGRSSFNESALSGESRPVEKSEGQEAVGGAVNGEGAVTLEVRKTGDQTYLSQVIDLVAHAQETRSRTRDVANRAALWLTYIALCAGSGTLAFWLFAGFGFEFALERMVTVMVIACPHALGLAVPLVVAISTKLSAQNGLLVRDWAAFERARKLQAVIFDKTGTLTEGRLGVSDVVALAQVGADDVLAWAAALESQSAHPIAQGIIAYSHKKALKLGHVESFRNLTGRGVEATVDGHAVKVVSPGYLMAKGLGIENVEVAQLQAEGKTVVFVVLDAAVIGAIALADIIRPESFETVARLKEMGIQCMMLTGDDRAVARTVSQQLSLDDFSAEVLPAQKAQKVREIRARGLMVAMIGDGVNDAPALVESDLGIAMGAGTEVAIEAADLVLVRSDPRDVLAILALSRATYRKIIQNLLWATGYNAFAIPLAAGVAFSWGIVLSPAAGAALMSVSTIIVAINAKLLERARGHVSSARA
jgi:Cu2+-exporting ATPase